MNQIEIQKMKDDINYIKKSLAGNGEKGLMKVVESLRETIASIQITLVKLQSYSHLKNWILGGAVAVLLAVTSFLIGRTR